MKRKLLAFLLTAVMVAQTCSIVSFAAPEVPTEEITKEENSLAENTGIENSDVNTSDINTSDATTLGEEDSDTVIPDDEDSDAVIPDEEDSDTVIPDDDASDVVIPDDEDSDAVIPDDEDSDVVIPDDEDSDVVIPDDEDSDVVIPDDEDSDAVTPEEKDSDKDIFDDNESGNIWETDDIFGLVGSDIEEIIQLFYDEFGEEAAAALENLLNNELLQTYYATVKNKILEQFPGMSEEEISAELEKKTEEELASWIEDVMSDPEITAALEAAWLDESFSQALEDLMSAIYGENWDDVWGDGYDSDDDGILDTSVDGAQGTNITWLLTTDGVLTISGTGAIEPYYEEYDGEQYPYYDWDLVSDYVKTIIIKDGVTVIPEDAFSYFWNASSVYIPASVTSIESWAFDCCSSLKAVYFYGNAPVMDEYAFGEWIDEVTFYYLEGTTGWDKLEGYNLKVWTLPDEDNASDPSESTPETTDKDDTEKGTSSDNNQVSKDTSKDTSKNTSTDASKDTPHTGDTAAPYAFILFVAAAAIIGILVIIKKRNRKTF